MLYENEFQNVSMSKHTLTWSLEIEEAFYVEGNGKSTSGCHSQHHDNAIADTPTAPAEPNRTGGEYFNNI